MKDASNLYQKESLFKQIFASYGNAGVFSKDLDDQQGLKEVRAILKFCISTHKRAYGKHGEIYFDYIDNPNFNALASEADGYEFITIFSGTIFHLYRLFFCFFSDPEILPSLGAANIEVVSKNVLNSIQSNTFESQHPKDQRRFSAAQNFATIACLLILTHEIGHIVNCHVHFLNRKFSLEIYEELPISNRNPLRNDLFHALEWEADEYSGVCTYLFLQQFGALFPIVEALGVDYIISVTALMLYIYIHIKNGTDFRSESPSHPSPFDRWMIVIINIHNHEKCKPFTPNDEMISKGIEDVLGFCKRHDLLDKSKFTFSVDTLDQTKRNYDQVRKIFKEYTGDLERIADERLKSSSDWFETNGISIKQMAHEAILNLEKNRVTNNTRPQ